MDTDRAVARGIYLRAKRYGFLSQRVAHVTSHIIIDVLSRLGMRAIVCINESETNYQAIDVTGY